MFILNRFDNLSLIEKVKCKILMIHGKQDKVIPFEHSHFLLSKCKAAAKLVVPEEMEHNVFNINSDIINHIREFFFTLFSSEEIIDSEDTSERDRAEFIKSTDFDSIQFPLFMYKCPS